MKSFYTLPMLICLIIYNTLYSQTATNITVSGAESSLNLSINTATIIEPNIQITANGNISGFTVSIIENYVSGDVLTYTGTLPSGITQTAFNTSNRSLVFNGTTSANNWVNILKEVKITSTATCSFNSRKVSFIAGNVFYNPENQHFYRINSKNLNWNTARSSSAALSYFGRIGYLLTINNASENSFIKNTFNSNCWLGLSDKYLTINEALGFNFYNLQSQTEGVYYWITGPERGIKVSNQNWTNGSVQPQPNVYNAWDLNQPVNTIEYHFGKFISSNAKWICDDNNVKVRTITEFGGLESDNLSSQPIFTKSISISSVQTGTIVSDNNNLCPGTNKTNLTLTNYSGTISKWQYSSDNFNTNTVDINSTSSNIIETNLNQTTYYRAILNTPNGCTNALSSVFTLNVKPNTEGNLLAENNTVCQNASINLSLTGNFTNIIKWQKANDANFTTNLVDISNSTINYSETASTIGTFYYRAVIQDGTCPLNNTPYYPISVIAGSVPNGGILNNMEHCGPGSFSGTLTLTNSTGTINKWQYSLDDGNVWIDSIYTSNSFNYTTSENIKYRVVSTNGSCGTAISSLGSIFIYGSTMCKWNGNINSNWDNNSNWCGGIPSEGKDILISSSANNHLSLTSDKMVGQISYTGANKNIYLENYNLTAIKINNSNLNNRIVSNGTGNLKMRISNGATGYFPIGNTTLNPVSITNNTGSSDYFGVNVADQVYLNGTNGNTPSSSHVKRTWNISKANPNSGNGIDISLTWDDSVEIGSINEPSLNHYNGSIWHLAEKSSSNYTSTTLNHLGYTGNFSPFAIADGNTALPSELIYFNVDCNANKNSLSWATSSEINTDKFIVEKSSDGYNWSSIGELKAAGNSNSYLSYSLIDPSTNRGINYYQLKQIDLNGHINIYGPISSNCVNDDSEFTIFPNPTINNCNILISSTIEEEYEIYLKNIEGKTIDSFSIKTQKGNSAYSLDLSYLKSGLYTIILSNENKFVVKKIILLDK